MQLPAWSRRSVIEDLLDINIFSKMNTLLKERNSKIKEELSEINHSLDLYKTKIDTSEHNSKINTLPVHSWFISVIDSIELCPV